MYVLLLFSFAGDPQVLYKFFEIFGHLSSVIYLLKSNNVTMHSPAHRLSAIGFQGWWCCHSILNILFQPLARAYVFFETCLGNISVLFISLSSDTVPAPNDCCIRNLFSSMKKLNKMGSFIRNDALLSRLPVAIIQSWYQREGYIKSMADLIEKELQIFSNLEEVDDIFALNCY